MQTLIKRMWKVVFLSIVLCFSGELLHAASASLPASDSPSVEVSAKGKVFAKIFFFQEKYLVVLTNGVVVQVRPEDHEDFHHWYSASEEAEYTILETEDLEFPYQIVSKDNAHAFVLQTLPDDESLYVGFEVVNEYDLSNIENGHINLMNVDETEAIWKLCYPEHLDLVKMWQPGDSIVLADVEVVDKQGNKVGLAVGTMMFRFENEDTKRFDSDVLSGVWVCRNDAR